MRYAGNYKVDMIYWRPADNERSRTFQISQHVQGVQKPGSLQQQQLAATAIEVQPEEFESFLLKSQCVLSRPTQFTLILQRLIKGLACCRKNIKCSENFIGPTAIECLPSCLP